MDGDGVFDFAWECEDRAERDLGDLPEAADEVGVVGDGEGDGECATELVEADGLHLFGDFQRDRGDGVLGDDRGKGVDVGDAEGIGPEAAGVVFGDQFLVDDGVEQLDAVGVIFEELGDLARVVEVGEVLDQLDERFIGWAWRHGDVFGV